MKNTRTTLLITGLLAGSLPAAVTLVNGDMEANTLANSGDFTSGTPPTGWVGNGTVNTIGEDRTSVNDDPTGIAWLHMQNASPRTIMAAAGSSIGDISSNLGSELNVTYVGTRRLNENVTADHTIALYAGSASTWVGGDVLASSSVTTNLANLTEGDPDSYYNGDLDLTLPGSYGGSGTNLWLVLQNDIPNTASTGQMLFDDVAISVIPEPASVLLAIAGLTVSALRRRR